MSSKCFGRRSRCLIADDLFVNFDDERTEASLRVLFELARSTQVIVFSHYDNVLASARRLADDGVPIHVHELSSERGREEASAAEDSLSGPS